jgi:septum formation protein
VNAATTGWIYLASRSPRRRELLGQVGVRHTIIDADVDEAVAPGEAPRDYVLRLARAKSESGRRSVVARGLARAPVLAADTTVALGNRILGKPIDRADAEAMLAELSGKRHEVFTAIALQWEDQVETALSASEVEFCQLDAATIRGYVASGEADDKAGAYAIQGRAAAFVLDLRGSYSGVMGLPLYETTQLLQRIAVPA